MGDVLTQAFQLQAVKYVQVAALTLLVHDAIICVDTEVRLIWSTPWSVPKVLYLISRYSPFIDTLIDAYDYLAPHPSPHVCYVTYSIASVLTAVGVAVSEIILFVRTWALWDRNSKLLYAFSALWIAGFTVVCWAVGTFVESIVFDYREPPLDRVAGCFMAVVDPTVFLCFVTLLVVELVLVSLTLWKGVKLLRQSHLSPLMRSFYLESIFFYLAIFPLTVGNVIIFLTAPSDLLDLLDTLMRVMHSILCCRILLHLRSAGHQHRQNIAWRRAVSGISSSNPSQQQSSRSGEISHDIAFTRHLARETLNSMDEGDEGVGREGGESGGGGDDGVGRGMDRKTASVRWEKEKIKSDRPNTRSVKRMLRFKSGVFAACHAKMESEGSRVSMLAAHQTEESQARGDSEQVLDIRAGNDYQVRNNVNDDHDHGVVEEQWRAEELYRYRTRSPRSRDLERGPLGEEEEVYEMERMG